MSKEKTELEKAHERAELRRAAEQAKKEQPKPVGPQPGGFQNRMNMPANADEAKAMAEQAKKEQAKLTKPKRDMQAMLNRVGSMINNLKKPSTQKSADSKSYVDRFKRLVTKSNNKDKGNSR
ncbi:MAG: hypothetical protein RLZZ81_1238 [Pseudomonadota bacterium]